MDTNRIPSLAAEYKLHETLRIWLIRRRGSQGAYHLPDQIPRAVAEMMTYAKSLQYVFNFFQYVVQMPIELIAGMV